MPTCFCSRIGLRKLQIQSTSIASTTTFVPPPHALPCWWDWDIMWVFLVSIYPTIISSTIKVAKKSNKGKLAKNNTPTLVFQGVDNNTWWIGWVQMMGRKFGMKWELCRQPVDLQKRQKLHKKKLPRQPLNYDVLIFPCSMTPQTYHDQTNCKWVDANSIMLNVTMHYDPTRKFYLLDLVNANLELR